MNHTIIIRTLSGLESVLEQELSQFGIKNVIKGNRMVSFEGNQKNIYELNLHLRSAISILKPIYSFKVTNEKELYQKIYEFDWKKILNENMSFSIDSIVFSDYFNHSHYVSLKIKDAIVDQFRNHFGKRPNIQKDNPDVKLDVYLKDDECRLSLNSSGQALYKRGYRKKIGKAPLNEVLAASMILLSEWNQNSPFLDFMCGSGTLPIEAALIRNRIAPGLIRKQFGFQTWFDFDEKLWNKLLDHAKNKIIESDIPIFGTDYDEEMVKIAQTNLNYLKDFDMKNINFSVSDFKEITDLGSKGTLIFNPPYGERLKQDNLNDFYQEIGDVLKLNFSGWQAWILSSNKEALKKIGLRTSKKLSLRNAAIDCKFQKYEMYHGSKKKK